MAHGWIARSLFQLLKTPQKEPQEVAEGFTPVDLLVTELKLAKLLVLFEFHNEFDQIERIGVQIRYPGFI